ncbi:MAG: cysteine desulfurase [Clostridia bacterium]|nr:cysteine desulfurase [Clostridia bacterium]
MIYLDNSATTKAYEQVIEKMADMQRISFGNPSSLHHLGVQAERELTAAKTEALKALGARDGQFICTAGGTEANNLAILGTMLSRIQRKPQIITTKIEHPSVAETVLYLQSLGADCHFVGVDSTGQVDEEEFCSLLSPETALVSIMTVNNEIGSVQDIKKLVRLTKKANPRALFHTDAVQALGKLPLKVQETEVDLLSVSAHKIHGPKGVGGLYIKKGVHVKPILHGGGQESGLRSGTQNAPGIAGFGVALSLMQTQLSATLSKMTELKEALIQGLAAMPDCRIVTPEHSAPHIVCAVFPSFKSETLLHAFEARGLYVSSGSACSSNKPGLSPTLSALGCSRKEIDGAIRFSLGTQNTMEDITEALSIIKEETALLCRA